MTDSSRSRMTSKLWLYLTMAVAVAAVVLWISRGNVERRLYPFLYQEEITTYATKNGLDPLFVASIIKNESRFNPDAVSRPGPSA